MTSSVDKESSSVHAIAVEREIVVYGSTVTMDLHSSAVCSGIRYWNVGTRGAWRSGGGGLRPSR